MLVKKYRPDLESRLTKKLADEISREVNKHIYINSDMLLKKSGNSIISMKRFMHNLRKDIYDNLRVFKDKVEEYVSKEKHKTTT